jgi:hypothetical protein
VPKIGGKRDMARGKGSDKLVFTCTDHPFGRVSAMVPRGDIFHSNILETKSSFTKSDFSLSMITCTIGRRRAEKKEHTDKKESLYAYLDLLRGYSEYTRGRN